MQDADQVQLPAVLLQVPLAWVPPIVPLQDVPAAPKLIALPFTEPEYTSPLGEQTMLMLQPLWEMVQLESWQEPERE